MAELDVLVVGSGGREYELARQMSLSEAVGRVCVAPGNAGTALLPKTENVDLAPTDVDGIVAHVGEKGVDAVIIGPDASMEAGLADALRAINCPVFGPNRNAARLEFSKIFATQFMQRHNIPIPESWIALSEAEALKIIKDQAPETYVIKADGLAAGKGVVLPSTVEEAHETLAEMFHGKRFGDAGKTGVVIQRRLHGPEVSAFAVTDGKHVVMLPYVQDHKRLKDNDEGPNTGGMGAYGPLPESLVSPAQADAMRDIAQRQVDGMAAEGTPYQGVMYIGFMLFEGAPVVIEDNSRFGDPETQVILPLLQNAGVDVADLLLRTARGDVSGITVPTKFEQTALTVALAAAGYPENPRKDDVITGLDKEYPNVIVQHAGTKRKGDNVVTAGGRVAYVTGFGETPDDAAAATEAAIGPDGVHFDGVLRRTDIGWQIRSKK